MSIIKFDAVRAVSQINGKDYFMYSGFLSSDELKKISEVPSFSDKKPHHQIASAIYRPPVDEWQRPLDDSKARKIKDIYSMTTKDNLMANPVLIGIAYPNIDGTVKINVKQKTVTAPDRTVIPITGMFQVEVSYLPNKKPLWVLDGQHRIAGMHLSTQKNQPMPFVLLYDDHNYDPAFLAEIFTQVTTGATPMKTLHSEWMQYAFDLGEYRKLAHKKAMEAVIHLCKDNSLGGMINPLQNKIQFNPYLTQPGYYAFTFNMQEWEKMIVNYYYGSGGTLSPYELAIQIAFAIKALEHIDSYKGARGSKLFSDKNHTILAEAFLYGILSHLAIHSSAKSYPDWVNYFCSPNLKFDTLNWSLPFVRTTGAMSGSVAVNASREIAKKCFDYVLNDPSYTGRPSYIDLLQGVGAELTITAYPKTPTGGKSTRNTYSEPVNFTGLHPFDTKDGGITREIITLKTEKHNCHIISVKNPTVVPSVLLVDATKNSGLDISGFISGQIIEVEVMHYSSDTRKTVQIRLDK